MAHSTSNELESGQLLNSALPQVKRRHQMITSSKKPLSSESRSAADQNVFDYISLINEQIEKIREGGLATFIAKIFKIPLYLIAIPMVIIIRVISPCFLIKMGELRSERIGHLALNTGVYLCEKEKNKRMVNKRLGADIFYYRSEISNYQLAKMWKRKVFCVPFVKYLHLVNKMIPGGEKFDIVTPARDPYGLLSSTELGLLFTEEEERLGQSELLRMGIRPGAPFICFYARNPLYLRTVAPKVNWNYHNHRDSDVNTMCPAMQAMADKGYYALRMGAVVEKKLTVQNSKIIDYAAYHRTDFMDIYLTAKCRFFVGTPAGIMSVAEVFRRPIVRTDCIPLEDMHASHLNTLHIFKKLWLKEERRYMTFLEIIRTGVGRFYSSDLYEQNGVEVVDNTPREILSVVTEMDERLRGSWQNSEEDEELQKQFWSLFQPNDLNQVFLARTGAEFLRQNKELLKR